MFAAKAGKGTVMALLEKLRNEKRDNLSARILRLRVEDIEPSPYQARTYFDEAEVESLAQSIRENGLLQPVSVRRLPDGRWQLIAGERRLRACRLAGLRVIPALECQADGTLSAVLGYIENAERCDLNCFEQARALRLLLELWDCTQEEGAARLGMSQSALCNKLRLLNLSEEEQTLCIENRLSERHARAVLSLPAGEVRKALLRRAAKETWSVAKLEQKVKEAAAPAPRKRRPAVMVRDVRIFLNTVNKAISLMKSAGIPAESTETRMEDYIEYRVRIPVKAR